MPLLFQSPPLSHPSKPSSAGPLPAHGWHSSWVSEPELEATHLLGQREQSTSCNIQYQMKVWCINYAVMICCVYLSLAKQAICLVLIVFPFPFYSNCPQMLGGCVWLYWRPYWSHLHQLDLTLSLFFFPLGRWIYLRGAGRRACHGLLSLGLWSWVVFICHCSPSLSFWQSRIKNVSDKVVLRWKSISEMNKLLFFTQKYVM